MCERWATFDCYGTLVDWNGGIRGELEKPLRRRACGRLLARYHELEPRIQAASPGSSYREVLTVALERLADETGLTLPEGERARWRARSRPGRCSRTFGRRSTEARRRGWRLAILSNTDRDLIDASMEAIGVSFERGDRRRRDRLVQARAPHWEVFCEQTRADPAGHVHVAQSLYHDIAPAAELGIPSIWINRLDEPADPRPSRTLPGVASLPDALDDLVPRRVMSSLRARCPDCRTFTAVAIGDGYECHRCGRTFGAGLVRVPRAWGAGGEAMAEGARLAVPYPEVGVVERRDT